jgi:hypothetical protein
LIDKSHFGVGLALTDLDGVGHLEIIIGEHDPFEPYHSRCRLIVYQQANPQGSAWWQYDIDNRFEHHAGAKPIQLLNGSTGIISHGWQEGKYVHLWEIE